MQVWIDLNSLDERHHNEEDGTEGNQIMPIFLLSFHTEIGFDESLMEIFLELFGIQLNFVV